MKMKVVDYIVCVFVILLFIVVASCAPEEDHCYEYYYYDEELMNECKFGICTQIVQETTTCISYEGK
jgi:hypothetical protein